MDLTRTFYLHINLAHLVNIHNFFEMIEEDIRTDFSQKIDTNNKDDPRLEDFIKIRKFTDLFNILEDVCDLYEIYIVIDGIEDLSLMLAYKKHIQKILVINSNFPKINVIIISNFDVSKSEICNYFNFSNFLSLCYPAVKNDPVCLKEIITNHLNISDPKVHEDVINKSLSNFRQSFCNLNEYLYNIRENIDESFYINYSNIKQTDYNIIELTNELSNISITDEIEQFKSKIKLGENDFIKVNLSNQKTEEFIDKLNKEKKIRNSNLKQFKLDNKLFQQVSIAPIHIKNIQDGVNNLSNFNSTKNLTESLSRSQKLIILASYLASESSPKLDKVIFRTVKKTKQRIKKASPRIKSLKSKLNHSFTLQRLIAIYSTLQTIVGYNDETIDNSDDEFSNRSVNVELISDINTLINLNLIRYVKLNDISHESRKLMGNVSIDFAAKIGQDFGIKISDFISLEIY